MKEGNMSDKEPNIEASIDKEIDSFIDGAGKDTTQESSPVETPKETQPEGGADPLKTESKVVEPGQDTTIERGPVPYDKFQESIHKRQEAERQLKDKMSELSRLNSLLDDPDIFKRHLKRQGYSDFEIRNKMQERGMPLDEGNTAKSVYDRVVGKLYGDKVRTLSQEDAQELRNTISLIEAVTREALGEEISPIKNYMGQTERQVQVDRQLDEVAEMSKQDEIDFEKEAIPAMQLILKEMQDRNPSLQRNPPEAMRLYLEASKRILKDKLKATASQEARDVKKGLAKPLVNGNAPIQVKEKKVLRTERDIDAALEAEMDALGFKN
jgi:hypothetical protein